MSSWKIANYGVDLFKLSVNPGGSVEVNTSGGFFRVDGDLIVNGTTTTVSSVNLDVSDSIITINNGETGTGITDRADGNGRTSGIHIDRGDNPLTHPDAYFLFDETLISSYEFDAGNLAETGGAFKFSSSNGDLLGIYTSSIRTQGNNNLYLLDQSNNGGVVVVNSQDYGQQIFEYKIGSDFVIGEENLRDPIQPDALINAKTLVDYVDSYHLYNWQDRIVAIYSESDIPGTEGGRPANPTSGVVSLVENVKVIVNSSTIGEFRIEGTTPTAEFTDVIVKGQIRSLSADDLVLSPGGTKNVSVSDKKIINLADPQSPQDAVNLRYLESRIGNLGLFDIIDPSTLESGSMLVYNDTTDKFEGTNVLDNQTIDAGTY